MIWLTPFFTVWKLFSAMPQTAMLLARLFDFSLSRRPRRPHRLSTLLWHFTDDFIYISFLSFQLSSSDVDYSIDQTLGDFNDAAPLFGSDTIQFMGITSFGPQTPIAPRQMPPLAYPQPKQQQSPAFNSNGITSSSQSQVAYNRPYNNINNNNNPTINNNNTSNNVNNYNQLKTSSSAPLILAPPPQSRANSNNSITPSNSNTFVRPPDSKPLMNGRSAYTTASQPSKHEVNITNWTRFCCASTLEPYRRLSVKRVESKSTIERISSRRFRFIGWPNYIPHNIRLNLFIIEKIFSSIDRVNRARTSSWQSKTKSRL